MHIRMSLISSMYIHMSAHLFCKTSRELNVLVFLGASLIIVILNIIDFAGAGGHVLCV